MKLITSSTIFLALILTVSFLSGRITAQEEQVASTLPSAETTTHPSPTEKFSRVTTLSDLHTSSPPNISATTKADHHQSVDASMDEQRRMAFNSTEEPPYFHTTPPPLPINTGSSRNISSPVAVAAAHPTSGSWGTPVVAVLAVLGTVAFLVATVMIIRLVSRRRNQRGHNAI